MEQDTDIGGPEHRFPETRHSAIEGVRSENVEQRARAVTTIVESYWKPVYKYIRIKWGAANEDAKDLTQAFFTIAIEKHYFAGYDPSKASFQTFIRTCLDRFIANQKKSEQRLKRGGGQDHLSLDFNEAESELSLPYHVSEITPEEYFHREWVRHLFALAVEGLRTHFDELGKNVHFQLFEAYDLREDLLGEAETETPARVSYSSLAKDFGLSISDVTNHLAATRREFRKIVLTKLRELTASDNEFEHEARSLLGLKIK